MNNNYLDIKEDEFNKLAENYEKCNKPIKNNKDFEKKKKDEEIFIKHVLEHEKIEETLDFTQKVHIMKETLKKDILKMKDENNDKQKVLNEDKFLKIVKK